MAQRVIGRWFALHNGIRAEVFDSGAIVLHRGASQEFFDTEGKFNSTNDKHAEIYQDLGKPTNLHKYVNYHGRPRGTIWGE